MTTALIIGNGNPLRRDDGVGPAVARALREVGAPARIAETLGVGGALLQLQESESVVILVAAGILDELPWPAPEPLL